ncbi:MAG: L,D-transpeptidase family protein [Henriciella sp.]
MTYTLSSKLSQRRRALRPSLFTATARGTFSGPGISCRCAVGRSGILLAEQKREGDGASPLGSWPMRRVFYRPDRVGRPDTILPCIALKQHDGWCDQPGHILYNRPVSLPFSGHHEVLWRDDSIYDIIVELGHNDNPVRHGLGSAVFLHVARPDYTATEGCIALSMPDLRQVLQQCDEQSELKICF